MKQIVRQLTVDLPERQSAFLWGPRKSGKTTWLRQAFPRSIWYDFLETDVFLRLLREPHRLREELLTAPREKLEEPVIIDEVQKIPAVLDEVHWLIENRHLRFVLCGSSARKVRLGHANLLGGRAWRFEMFPLTSAEVPELDLLRALNAGLLPTHYFGTKPALSLKAYVTDYLTEEIKAEGLVRNLAAFARFLDAMSFSHGELTIFASIARDCGVDAKTVRSYYDILVDTLLGHFIPPYRTRVGRQTITEAEKFYLFDVGVAGFIGSRIIGELKGEEFGKAFEHFILMELLAHRGYRQLNHDIKFWRTKSGLEVDFVLGDGMVAIEVKGSTRVDAKDLRGMRTFVEEYKPTKAFVVCQEPVRRMIGSIEIVPWREFLGLLWNGGVI